MYSSIVAHKATVDSHNRQKANIIVVVQQQSVLYDRSISLFSLLVGIFTCIIGFMNTHDDCYTNTGIGKLNLPIMLIFMGFSFALSGASNLRKGNYDDEINAADGVSACFLLIWLIMFIIILVNSNSTCATDNKLLYYTALGGFNLFMVVILHNWREKTSQWYNCIGVIILNICISVYLVEAHSSFFFLI